MVAYMGVTEQTSRPDKDVLVIKTSAQKWRLVCPYSKDRAASHHDWRLWNGTFECRTCKSKRDAGELDVDPRYKRLWDMKDERWVTRDQLEVDR